MTAVFDAPRSWVGDLARDPTSTNFLLDLNDIYVTYLIDFERHLCDFFERFCEDFVICNCWDKAGKNFNTNNLTITIRKQMHV